MDNINLEAFDISQWIILALLWYYFNKRITKLETKVAIMKIEQQLKDGKDKVIKKVD